MINFIKGRTKAIYFSVKGAFHLIKTENAIQAQLFFSLMFIIAGFYFEISSTEWIFQLLAICLVLSTESLNTAVEKIADFIHPNYNDKIGIIKDISAGAVFFSALFALVTASIIYFPKFF